MNLVTSPEDMLATPTVFGPATSAARARDLNAWVARHNSVVLDYVRGGVIDGRLSASERAILALADGLRRYVTLADVGDDLLAQDRVLRPMFEAFRMALNWDLGRLDAGTLDAWAYRLFRDATGSDLD